MNEWEEWFEAWLKVVVAEWDGRVDHGWDIWSLMWDELENGQHILEAAGPEEEASGEVEGE